MRKSAIIFLTLSGIAVGCSHKDNTSAMTDNDFVAQYRDSVLRMSDIVRQLPPDISSADSAVLISKIADQWIEGFLIEDLAASQIDDLDRINALTDMYRRSLIADSYRRKMRQSGVQPVDLEKVKEYYQEHGKELRLERPIVKGLYIRVPADSRRLDEIRNWMKNAGPETYDALENTSRLDATTFRYFADQWVDFDIISGEIPYKFGDADKFVTENVDFETELNGMVHILHISDHKISGERMPEEYATPLIEDRMKALHLADYEAGLIKALRTTAIEKNILTEGSYIKQDR